MSRSASLVTLVRTVLTTARRHQVTFLAAGVAYYAFVSLVPLLLVALAVGSAVGGEELAAVVVDATGSTLTPSGEELVRDALVRAEGRATASVVGTLLLLWSGLKLFRGLDLAFSRVYHRSGPDTLVNQVADALTVLVSVGVAAAVVVGLGGLVPLLGVGPVADFLSPAVVPGALLLAVLPIYYVFPDAETSLRGVLPGAAVAALGWTALAAVFGLYAANAGQFALYGILGAVLLLVTWLYLAAIVMILGAILNAVLAGDDDDADTAEESGSPPDEPAPDLVSVAREVREVRERVEDRTVDRDDLESDLRRYVRRRARRGHARGWGPYLVLLYGTAMTVGAYYFLSGGWAILAMLVVWLSTLGLYVVMLAVGAGLSAAGAPGRLLDWVRNRRSGDG